MTIHRRHVRLIAATFACLAIGAGAWLASRPRPGDPGGSRRVVPTAPTGVAPPLVRRFVGDPACRACHPGESAAQARSGHSQTLRRAEIVELARGLVGRSVADPDPDRPGVTWTYRDEQGTLVVERREGATVERLPLGWAFGSGVHALTFVSVPGDPTARGPAASAFEHRLSLHVKEARLEITTGQGKDDPPSRGATLRPDGRALDAGLARKCFDCHATLPSAEGYDAFDPATLIANVGCERCHGPGREHVEAARRGETGLFMPHGSRSRDADLQTRLCSECHRHPKDLPRASIRPDNAGLTRFQPVGLLLSKCYGSGRTGLKCTTCHDPHDRPSRDQAAYDRECLTCHGAPGQTHCATKPAPESGCVDCHMPKRMVPEGFSFTDHWIRKPDGAAAAPAMP